MLSIAILDDNKNMLDEYTHIIPIWCKKNNIKYKIVVATTDYKEFIHEIQAQCANVCILDINLRSDVSGLFIAQQLRKKKIPIEIIFCTGLLEYMPLAFDVNAYNFIAKPLGRNMEKCLVKLNRELEARESKKKVLEVPFSSRIYYIPFESITHIQRCGVKTIINTENRVLEVYESLISIYKKLNDPRFIKCHRSTIVNSDFVDFYDKKSKKIFLKNGCVCEAGTKFSISASTNDRSESNELRNTDY